MLYYDQAAMLGWLASDLTATDQDWIIAAWHHPPYSKGRHDSDVEGSMIRMRSRVLPLLEDTGVDLVLTGHSHSYERSYLIDGHYGNSTTLTASMIKNGGNGRNEDDGAYIKPAGAHNGAVYVVAGMGGRLASGPLNHPAMHQSLLQLGSVVLDVDGNQLDATFLDSGGNVGDRFTIIKTGLDPDPTATPTATASPTASPSPTHTATATSTQTPTPTSARRQHRADANIEPDANIQPDANSHTLPGDMAPVFAFSLRSNPSHLIRNVFFAASNGAVRSRPSCVLRQYLL